VIASKILLAASTARIEDDLAAVQDDVEMEDSEDVEYDACLGMVRYSSANVSLGLSLYLRSSRTPLSGLRMTVLKQRQCKSMFHWEYTEGW
jgi:hypothetical protein